VIYILKYHDTGKSLFASAAQEPIVDKIRLTKTYEAEFPIFDLSTEMVEGVARRKAGEFNIVLSYLQDELSATGENIQQFLRGGTRSYRFVFVMQIEGFVFHGTFKSADIESDFTYTEGRWQGSFYVRDTLAEMAEYAETLNTYFPITHLDTLTFESYMNLHVFDFAPLFYFPEGAPSFAQRCGDSSVVFAGSVYDIPPQYTDWRSVSRWETFKGLAQGLGFDYDLELRDVSSFYEMADTRDVKDMFRFKIFFKSDIEAEEPIVIDKVISLREITIPKTKKYLFISYRQAVFNRLPNGAQVPPYTAIRGILYDGGNIIDSDSGDNLSPLFPHYNFFLKTTNAGFAPFDPNRTLLYITGNGEYSAYDENSEINQINLRQYSHPGFGGTHALAGSIAYSRIFNCTGFNFYPIQRFAITNLTKNISSLSKVGKEIEIKLNKFSNINLNRHVKIAESAFLKNFQIVKITEINIIQSKVKLQLQEL